MSKAQGLETEKTKGGAWYVFRIGYIVAALPSRRNLTGSLYSSFQCKVEMGESRMGGSRGKTFSRQNVIQDLSFDSVLEMCLQRLGRKS